MGIVCRQIYRIQPCKGSGFHWIMQINGGLNVLSPCFLGLHWRVVVAYNVLCLVG